jgi:hypothetical protein
MVSNFQSKEVMKLAQVLNSKFRTQGSYETISGRSRGANKDNIININQKIHSHLWTLKNKEGCVSCRWSKTKSR